MEITCCQYSMGTPRDYQLLKLYHRVSTKKPCEYSDTQEEAAEILESIADVYFFQEVGSFSRSPLILSLKEKNYYTARFSKSDSKGCVLALSQNKFRCCRNFSFKLGFKGYCSDVAVASAVEKLSRKRFLFASLYIPSFSFFYYPNVDTSTGDLFLVEAVKSLRDLKADIIVLGVNMNNQPELHKAPFIAMKALGFTLKRVGHPTCVDIMDYGFSQKREVDFFFVKTSEPLRMEPGLSAEMDVASDPSVCSVNSSRHTPITIRFKEENDWMVKLWDMIVSFFK